MNRHPPSHMQRMGGVSCGCYCPEASSLFLSFTQGKILKETAGLGRDQSAENDHTEPRGWEGHQAILGLLLFFFLRGKIYRHFPTVVT